MKSNFLVTGDTEKFFWVSPQELLGAEGLPGSIAGLHYRANTQGWEKRKKEGIKGGKAVEYNLMSLPEPEKSYALKYLGFSEETGDAGGVSKSSYPAQAEMDMNQKLAFVLNSLIDELEPDEAKKAFKLISHGGLPALMPTVFSEQHLFSLFGVSQQSIQTLLMLEALAPEARKEILAKYSNTEQACSVTPADESKESHKKAG